MQACVSMCVCVCVCVRIVCVCVCMHEYVPQTTIKWDIPVLQIANSHERGA